MRWFTTAVMLLAATACASAPVARNFEDVADYRAVSFAEIWDIVVDMSGERNWAIESLDRDSGTISTDWTRTDDVSYRDCGSAGFRATDSDHMGRFSVLVRETANGVSVRVATSWRVTRNSANSVSSVDCLSTGILERELHDELRRRLG